MIAVAAAPAAVSLPQPGLTDPLVLRYRDFFALLDWTLVPERESQRPWPGRTPHPTSAYIKALVVKVGEHLPYITTLRAFLLEHPGLVVELGFLPVRDPTQPWGIDLDRTVPCARWLRHQQRTLDPHLLAALLADTVQTLSDLVPDVGTTVAVDVKHIYAWVSENNPKASVPQRFDPTRQPRGDPDCRLGIKRRSNQAGATPTEYLWGYGTGLVSALTTLAGDVVLAEATAPFNRTDITYYAPLHAQAQQHLGVAPTNVAADAAFDAWHVYHSCAIRGGLAAIPLNDRGPRPQRSPDGHPYCDHGYVMTPTSPFVHEDGYRAQHYRCPLRYPHLTGEVCADARFAQGGCRKVVNIEAGGLMRLQLDRTAPAYLAVYRQRTSAERINAQATALGIERPKVRRAGAVARLNTLTYIVINLRAIQRAQARQQAQAPP
jgi:hypothetical protein